MVYITSFLWFDREAREAAEFYTSIFKNSRIKNIEKMQDTPSGTVEIIIFDLLGKEYSFMSAGPFHKINPSISYNFITNNSVESEEIWKKISPLGQVLMDFGKYPFADKFGWVQDKFGVSWQIMFSKKVKKPLIKTNLMFVGKGCGKAEEALNFYTSIFKNSSIDMIQRYGEQELPEKTGSIKHAEFSLESQDFTMQESANDHKFYFNESMSFVINCKNQEEIDYYWNALTSDPKAEQCGWLKDKFDISWQVVPTSFSDLMKDSDKEREKRKREFFLKMKKIDIEELKNIN